METDPPIAPTDNHVTEPVSCDEDWEVALRVLERMLKSHDGIVSSRALRKELERKGVEGARDLAVKLKLYDFESADSGAPRPDFRFYHRGRSFYSEPKYREAEANTDAAADDASEAETLRDEREEEEVPVARRRTHRQEEARLVTYVREALETWYDTDAGPEAPIAFDVHNERPGSDFENVDVIAVHWRSDDVVDVVSVEVKLDFTAKLVQQANNYTRFSNRVWIAVPVQAYLKEAAFELREYDPLLFEYVLNQGLGILACRRGRGRSYEVAPIHWPRLFAPDTVERDTFIERYRSVFEEAQVIAPESPSYPRLR